MIVIKHKLTGAVLRVVESDNLRVADLSGANLSGADLRGADLRGASLYGANLSGAIFATGWVLARAEELTVNEEQINGL